MQAELSETLELEHEAEDRGDDFAPDTDEPKAASGGDGAEPPEGNEEDTETEDEGEEPEAEEPRAIPQARFNEVNERYKAEREARLALEEELARTRGQSTAPQDKGETKGEGKAAAPFDLEAAEDRLLDCIAEGDTAEAKALQKQIRAYEREQLRAQITAETQAEFKKAEQVKEAARLQHAALALYQKYPMLDGSGKAADADLIEMVVALRNDYIQSGTKPADALEKAAEKVCGKLGKAQSTAPKAEAAVKANVTRNLEREAQIPPRGAGKGTRSQPVDLAGLSDAEFSKLSAEDLARARGDYLDG